ncbi:O-antigen ligase family protein [Nostoc sp. CHAB 5844]|nr:O-antigen ligase family protein [Nostoc sp. CHAB 5844]
MRKLLRFAEYAFTVVSLLHYSGGPLVVILSGGASEGDGSEGVPNYPLIQLILMVIYIITFCLLVLRWKKVVYVLSKDKFIWLLVALAGISVFWSSIPELTRARSIALAGTTIFGLYLATRYTLKEQLQLFAWMFGIAIVFSCLFAVALPQYGLMAGLHAGAWRGIYNHKNVLGKIMVPSIFIFLCLAFNDKKNRFLLWCGCILSIILLILSTSKSSLLNFVLLLGALGIYQVFRWQLNFMMPAITGLATIGFGIKIWLSANADRLLASVGKDATLTGRTDLWPLVLDKIWERPLLGYGFGSFWYGWESEAASIWYASGWSPPNAHNGLLDLFLDLGILGVTIYLLAFCLNFFKALFYLRLNNNSENLWPIIYITYILLANLTESTMVIQNNIFWIFYVTVIFSLSAVPKNTNKVFA